LINRLRKINQTKPNLSFGSLLDLKADHMPSDYLRFYVLLKPKWGGPSDEAGNAGMLRLVSEILPRIKSAKQCDVTIEFAYLKLCISGFISVFM
jgi:hypothetical protein